MANIKWVLDPNHSEVSFKVKHLMISTVNGRFKKFNVAAETEGADFTGVKKLEFSADIDSIDTNNEQRDGHLKSADFFDAVKFPQLKFVGKTYDIDGDEGKISGDLTMHGVTKLVTLHVELGGVTQDPYGNTKAGFTVTGKLNRKEFDLTWGVVTETGSILLADDVKISAEIQLAKQVEALVGEAVAG
jgi:polyisoprenoid-binding protein YceI